MFRPCEYELIPPHHTMPEPGTEAEAEAGDAERREAEWCHPDAGVSARAVTLSRSAWARRFVLFETLDTEDLRTDRPAVFPLYQGFRNTGDGSVVIVKRGQPYGWYTSIASAWRRLKRSNGLFVAWLEPDPALPDTSLNAADLETSQGPTATWYLTIPYTAHGPSEARQRGFDVTTQLESCLPGLDRYDVTFRYGGEADTEMHVFCESPGCLHPAGHDGDHQPPPTAPAIDETDTDDDWPQE